MCRRNLFRSACVPVTAKLSKLFYDRFGDQVVGELVDWFNSVDATYSANLRDLNEVNFARFDAKLRQRFAEQDAKFEKRFVEQDAKFEKQFVDFDVKFEKRFVDLDVRLEKRFAGVDVRFERLDAKIDRVATEQREFMERALKDQTRWMFVAWGSLLIPIIGLWVRP
jgi:hypothetical protein